MNMKENWEAINGQFQKCSILKDINTTYSGSSEKIDLSEAINTQSPDYLRGKSDGYKEGFNKAMEQLVEIEKNRVAPKKLIITCNPDQREHWVKELKDKSVGEVLPEYFIIPMTEEDKKRDREQIAEYMRMNPKSAGIPEHRRGNLSKWIAGLK